MKTFNNGAEGRIYTDTQENVERIKQIIKNIDEFEYPYLPDDFVAVWRDGADIDLIPNWKFYGLDLQKIEKECTFKNIPCGCFIGKYEQWLGGSGYVIDDESYFQACLQFVASGFWSFNKLLEHFGMNHVCMKQD